MGCTLLRPARVVLAASLAVLLGSATASAHLCNDVFVQAKDNLAVKVDIRDGQLRIDEEASFRVYLLNTMDRPIANIALDIRSEQFAADVKPSAEWRGFPQLASIKQGGKKEFFEVTLRRKAGVRDGRYRIELHLYNGQNPQMVFKTLDLGASTDALDLPRLRGVSVDGSVGSTEWKKALLVSDFYTYERRQNYHENVRAEDQPRYRVGFDDEFLYALFSVRKGSRGADRATMYVAKDPDATAVAIDFDLRTGEAKGTIDVGEIQCRLSPRKESLECRIPRKLLGLDGADVTSFLANFSRTTAADDDSEGVVSYWRGNSYSVGNPVVYARLNLAAK